MFSSETMNTRNSSPTAADLGSLAGAVEPMTYWRYKTGRWTAVPGLVIRETPVTIFLNQRELVTILCTPLQVRDLALGFLFNEGIIDSLADVALMRVCDEDETVDVRLSREGPVLSDRRVLTASCGGAYSIMNIARDLPRVQSPLSISAAQVLALVARLQTAAVLFKQAGGVHTAALADGGRLIWVAEDVGRHNTIDKICGRCLIEGTPTAGRLLLTTGRLSSEMVVKAARMGVPIVVSRNSPTARAVTLAEDLGITLIGYARGGGLTLYSRRERLAGWVDGGTDL